MILRVPEDQIRKFHLPSFDRPAPKAEPRQAQPSAQPDPAPTMAPAPEPVVPMVTEAELAAIRQAAKAEAWAEGYEAGRQQGVADGVAAGQESGAKTGFDTGYAEGLAKADVQLQQLAQVLTSATGELANVERIYADFLAGITRALADVLEAPSPEVLGARIQRAMSTLADVQGLAVTLNPADLALINETLPWLAEDTGARLVGSDKITPGGFTVRTATGTVDATVETKLAELKETLRNVTA